MRYDAPGVRVSRLEEALTVLKRSWADGTFSFRGEHYTILDYDGWPKPLQRPHPPILIGAGGRLMIRLAAREADIVGITVNQRSGVADPGVMWSDPENAEGDPTARRLEWLRQAAGARFESIELSVHVFAAVVTADRRAGFEALGGQFGLDAGQLARQPQLLVGTLDQMATDVIERRARYGISYYVFGVNDIDAVAPLVERLAGT
jgi:alkanesulfonate monooxygenase SsuD/methylene tetrahydromethanopterin reductase-like flavin-dependent oxidoreductase (luciferase family)